jgi:molecular chaperone IbpA
MRAYDFSPLWRSSVGFDRLFDQINNTQLLDNQDGYPPYDIVRTGEETYRISLAVAGFAPNDLAVTAQQNLLTVSGRNPGGTEQDYIYQGIAARPFERRFQLADHVIVTGANSENGLLHIDLVREVPEAQKPRTIAINKNGKNSKTIEAVKAPTGQAA